jgi:hypothetical protein
MNRASHEEALQEVFRRFEQEVRNAINVGFYELNVKVEKINMKGEVALTMTGGESDRYYIPPKA